MNAAVNPLPGTGEMQEPDAPRTDGVFVNSPDARQAVLEAMDGHDRIDAERAECNAERQGCPRRGPGHQAAGRRQLPQGRS